MKLLKIIKVGAYINVCISAYNYYNVFRANNFFMSLFYSFVVLAIIELIEVFRKEK